MGLHELITIIGRGCTIKYIHAFLNYSHLAPTIFLTHVDSKSFSLYLVEVMRMPYEISVVD